MGRKLLALLRGSWIGYGVAVLAVPPIVFFLSSEIPAGFGSGLVLLGGVLLMISLAVWPYTSK